MKAAVTQNAKSLLNIVVDSMDQGLLVVSADLTVPILSVRATELIDLPRSFADNPPPFPEILAYQVKVGAITAAYMKSSINTFILQGDQMTETHTYTRKTATGRWLDVHTTPLPQGGFVRTFTDQTERHTIAAAKEQSENNYRSLFENAAVGIYRSGVDGIPLRINPELVALIGYRDEEHMLRDLADVATECYVDSKRLNKFREILHRDGRITEFESEVYRHPNRERIWVSESAWVVRDEDGNNAGYEGTVVEVTERKKLESLINHAAHHDALTGLPNRASFNQMLDDAMASRKQFFLAYLDLDGFKAVNDTYGHGLGDDLLVAIASRFRNSLRVEEPVFRMGGDEFAIILFSDDLDQANKTLSRLVTAIEVPFRLGEILVEIGFSAGIAASDPSVRPLDILHQADIGLYRAKEVDGSAISYEGPITPAVEQFRNSA